MLGYHIYCSLQLMLVTLRIIFSVPPTHGDYYYYYTVYGTHCHMHNNVTYPFLRRMQACHTDG